MSIDAKELNDAIHDLRVLHSEATPGVWQKGKTTHNTVSILPSGESYHVADFRHAKDAAFIDAAHKYIIPLLNELEALRKNYPPINKEFVLKNYASLLPMVEPTVDDATEIAHTDAPIERNIGAVEKAYTEWFIKPGQLIELPDTTASQKGVILAALASEELRESVTGLKAAETIELRDALFDYFLVNPNHKHSYFSEIKPYVEKNTNAFTILPTVPQFGITGIRITLHEGTYVLAGLVDKDAPVGEGPIGVASYVTYNKNEEGFHWTSMINQIFSFYNFEDGEAMKMIDSQLLTSNTGKIVRHRSIIEYLISRPHDLVNMNEKIAEELITEESNMAFSQKDMMVTGWEFAVWSEPTLVGLEAVLYLAHRRCKDKKGALKLIENKQWIDYTQPFGITIEGAQSIITAERKNGFEFDGVDSGKGGRVWCSEIKSIALLEAVITVIIAKVKEDGYVPYRLSDAVRDHLNISND